MSINSRRASSRIHAMGQGPVLLPDPELLSHTACKQNPGSSWLLSQKVANWQTLLWHKLNASHKYDNFWQISGEYIQSTTAGPVSLCLIGPRNRSRVIFKLDLLFGKWSELFLAEHHGVDYTQITCWEALKLRNFEPNLHLRIFSARYNVRRVVRVHYAARRQRIGAGLAGRYSLPNSASDWLSPWTRTNRRAKPSSRHTTGGWVINRHSA